MSVMALTNTFTCPDGGTERVKIKDGELIIESSGSLRVTSTVMGVLERD